MNIADIKNTVMELYVGLLGRAADQAGFAYWVEEIHSGKLTFENLRASFATQEQPEYWNIYGALNNNDLAVKVYQNLLNREPDTAGLAYWVNELDSGKIEPGQFINAVINGVKDDPSNANAGRLVDIETLKNKVSAANYFTQESQTADPNSTEFANKAKDAVKDVDDSASVATSKTRTDTDVKSIPKIEAGVRGTPGDDVLKSADDYTIFYPGDGNDTIIATGAEAEINYFNASAAVIADMSKGTTTGSSTSDTFSDTVVKLIGSNFDDQLIGGNSKHDEWEAFDGGKGNDTIDGGSGTDELYYTAAGGGTQGAVVDFAKGTAIDNFGDTDTFSNMENARGSHFDDTFIGSSTIAYMSLRGFAGSDTFQGAVYDRDNDTGYERVDYSKDYKTKDAEGNLGDKGINVDLSSNTATDGFGHTDTLTNIDYIKATKFNDTLKGDNHNNRFEGGEGNDTFVFAGSWGWDRVRDFVAGEDKLDLSQTTLTFADLTMEYNTDKGELRIHSGENAIRLEGIQSVEASDFIFA